MSQEYYNILSICLTVFVVVVVVVAVKNKFWTKDIYNQVLIFI